MKKFSFKWFISTVIAGAAILTFSNNDTTVQATNIFGCYPKSERLDEVNSPEKFKKYLELIDIPYEKYIAKAGKKLAVDMNTALNKCLIVYGTPNDVKNEGRLKQSELQGEPKFLGYNEKGKLVWNPNYPDYADSPDYVKTSNFVKNPWNNKALQESIKSSSIKPYSYYPSGASIVSGYIQFAQPSPTYKDPKIGRVRTKVEELNRAIDRMYLTYCGSNCSLGPRGYFTSVNNHTNVALTGQNLQYYASIIDYPDEYTPGSFVTYRNGGSGSYLYSTFYLPPYKLFLSEKRDLSIKINSIKPNSLIEGYSYAVNYTVCNKGELPVKNPVIHYGEGSATKSKTLKVTLKELQCYTGNISEKAGNVNSDVTKNYVMEVNKNRANPKDEDDLTNNKDTKELEILNKVIDGQISITGWTPTYPHSKQELTIKYQLCNNSNVPVFNATYKVGFKGDEITKSVASMDPGECITGNVKQITDVIKNYTDERTVSAKILSGFDEDINLSNNSETKQVTVRNPDVFTDILVDNDSSDNTIGNVKVKVENRTWSTVTETCNDSNCNPGTSKKEYVINVFDTKFTSDTNDDVLVATYKPTFNLDYSEKDYFNINRSVFTNWVKDHYPDTYQLVQFKIVSQIPEYKTEVDWLGEPSYKNNRDEDIVNYFPPREVAATQCNEVEHSISSYFTATDGFNPIKMCAGHYPTYPSTTVESGMQAYHYVLYRFFPQPMPKYTVITPEADDTNPNHFSQIYQLPVTENYNQMGDFESMYFPKKLKNNYYQERGRYLPVGGTFDFEVYKKNKDGSKGEQIALGTVSYNIPDTCYDRYKLDINHQYGCDEIMFFLPNPDVASLKHEKPASHDSTTITYPISNTRIPYLNPGTYTFEFNANENFRYYYQTNLIDNGYRWGNPRFK